MRVIAPVDNMRQVRCKHPRHPSPDKAYALRLVVNYDAIATSRDVAREYGLDCDVLRRLPHHANVCSLLAEFKSTVPYCMHEHLCAVCDCACAVLCCVELSRSACSRESMS
jgi:hypothetical protein